MSKTGWVIIAVLAIALIAIVFMVNKNKQEAELAAIRESQGQSQMAGGNIFANLIGAAVPVAQKLYAEHKSKKNKTDEVFGHDTGSTAPEGESQEGWFNFND